MGCLGRSLLMLVLPFALIWVPVPGLGGFLAGGIGGYLSGAPGRALASALFPTAVIAAIIVALGFHFGVPLLGSLLGGFALIWLILHDLTYLAGTLVGSVVRSIADRRRGSALSRVPGGL